MTHKTHLVFVDDPAERAKLPVYRVAVNQLEGDAIVAKCFNEVSLAIRREKAIFTNIASALAWCDEADRRVKNASIIEGLGPEAETVVNEAGAKQSFSPCRCDLLPASATLHVAAILKYGADKYGANNWRGIPTSDHINHALTHIFAFLADDKQDDHLGHAACRILMALEKFKCQ